MTPKEPKDAVEDLIAFLDAAPSPYHAVHEATRRLSAQGFQRYDEREEWALSAGAKGFVVRGGGTIVAFELGTDPPARAGFRILGAHTDSPNLRVKPRPDHTRHGYHRMGVEVYGGVLLHTWLDRDLSLAGRVSLLDGRTHLVRIDRPICSLPNLAIHLNQSIATSGLVLNAQEHLVPVLGLTRDAAPELSSVITESLRAQGVDARGERIAAFELCLFDTQGASVSGANGEFLNSARLDNLASCHAALEALTTVDGASRASRVVVLYDHEEVGSLSAVGARSHFILGILERLASGYGDGKSDPVARALAHSLLVSSDMAHAVHPNYSDRHDPQHLPRMGRGPVIKINAGQSYATDAPGAAAFEAACREAGFSAQRFVSRNDLRCGSTIGPISAAQLSVRTVDVGNPMLGMHSCRETAGTADVSKMIRALSNVLSMAQVPEPTS